MPLALYFFPRDVPDEITRRKLNLLADQVNSNFNLEIARGNVEGMSAVNKFGRNSNIAANSTEDIWSGSALYVFPDTALMTSISQTTDQAAMRGGTIEVQGLDSSWDKVTQNVILDAADTTTVVTLDTALIRCYRMKVLEDIIASSPIRVHNAGETQDYAIIGANENQTLMAIWTVANGFTAYITRIYASLNPATNQDPTSMNIRLWVRDNDNMYERQIKHVMGLHPTGTSYWHHQFDTPVKVTQKSDIYIDGTTVGKAADISAGFDVTVVDNTLT